MTGTAPEPSSAPANGHAPPRFGEIATAHGFVDGVQVAAALEAQRTLAGLGLPERLGAILRKRGQLTTEQVADVLRAQGADPLRDLVPGFAIEARLGQGGMGAVYRARRLADGRTVALKLLPPRLSRDGDAVTRFVREAEAAASLRHPHVIAALGTGRADDHHWVAMEYVEGESLDARLAREGALPEVEVRRIATAVASALDHAHAHGLVHRDVKPGNVLLGFRRGPEPSVAPESDGRRPAAAPSVPATDAAVGAAQPGVYLTDFGLAKWTDADSTAVTQSGVGMGTPQYVAPEQARGAADVDIRADLFALAATCYHALAGQPPFGSGTAAAVLARRLVEDPAPLRTLAPECSPGLAALVHRCLAREPEGRPSTPRAVLDALAALPEPGAEPAAAPRRLGSAVFAAAAGVAIALGIGLLLGRPGGAQPTTPAGASASSPGTAHPASGTVDSAAAAVSTLEAEARELRRELADIVPRARALEDQLFEAARRQVLPPADLDRIVAEIGHVGAIERRLAALEARLAAMGADAASMPPAGR